MLQLGPLDPVLQTFGPFVIPIFLFALGVVGYLVVVALGKLRRGGD